MVFIQKKYNNILLAFMCLTLLVSIFYWIHFLTINTYITECFKPGTIQESSATSHSVDLPLTTKYSCRNFCGPNARCSITGQQCMADIDCPGCQPYSPPLSSSGQPVPGDNDAGKLTLGVTPQYSSLTSGYGTQESVITNNMFSKPSMPNFGGNIWISKFELDENLYYKRYKPNKTRYMPNYPKRYSLTGQFVDEGPFAANASLHHL
jgi:hypothetical protein